MRFTSPWWLLLLLLVPVAIAAWLVLERRRSRYAVRYTNIEVLATVVAGAPRWRRFVPLALVALAFVAALVAIARPQLRGSERRENASIALVLDISGSMQADDVKPTRLGAAQAAIRRFLEVLPDRYRAGLVTFAAEPFVAAPLTRDRRQIRDTLQYNLGTGRGTAIGDAIARGVELLRPVVAGSGEATAAAADADSDKPVSAILLLSDGAQRGGILRPLEGAARAKSYGIPVYTVALGATDGSQTPGGGGSGGGFGGGGGGGGFNRAPDPETLRQIAQATGGSAFATSDGERLRGVYERLASRLGTEPSWRPAGHLLLGLAALLALASAAASLRWVHRLP